MKFSKQLGLIILIITTVIGLITLVYFTQIVSQKEPQFENEGEADSEEQEPPIEVLLTLQKSGETVELTAVNLLPGTNLPLFSEDSPEYLLEQVINGQVIEATPLNFSQHDLETIISEDGELFLPLLYHRPAELRIRNVTQDTLQNLNTQLLLQTLDQPKPPPVEIQVETIEVDTNEAPPDDEVLGYNTQIRDGNLDIVFINSGFPDQDDFSAKANRLAFELKSRDPFTAYGSKIRFQYVYTSANIGCNLTTHPISGRQYLKCDNVKLNQILSQVKWDVGVVVDNRSLPGAAAASGQIIYMNIAPEYYNTFIHEIGHAVGDLDDEYVEQSLASRQLPENIGPNCDVSANCPKWSNVPGTQCIPGCYYPQAYRSSQNSIMRTNSDQTFNAVSRRALISQLDSYTTLPTIVPAPQLVTSCEAKYINGKPRYVPIINVEWSQDYPIKMVTMSTKPDFQNSWKSDLLASDVNVDSRIRETNGVRKTWFVLFAPSYFKDAEGEKAEPLENDTTYYVKFWDGVNTGPAATIKTLACTERIDFNGDGVIDNDDLDFFISEFGKTGELNAYKSDLLENGVVNIYDYNFFVSEYQRLLLR